MHDPLPHVGPRQAYAEVYLTHAPARGVGGFSQVLSGFRSPVPGDVVERSAAAIRDRIVKATGEDTRLDPTAMPIHAYTSMSPGRANKDEPMSPTDAEARCIVSAIVKTPLGIRTSSHVESLRQPTHAPLVTAPNGLSLTRATSGTQDGMPSRIVDFSTKWSEHARRVAVGQHTYLNLMSFFLHTSPSRTTGGNGDLLACQVTSQHDGLAGMDDSINVLDRTDPIFDRAIVAGHDINTDMMIAETPTIATALTLSSGMLVSDEANRKATYAVESPW